MTPRNEEFFVNLGKRIEERRNARGLSATDAAEAIGISRGYWGNLENAKNTPNAVRLMALIAEYLETTVDYLLGLSANPSKQKESDGASRLFSIFIQLADARRDALIELAEGMYFNQLKQSALTEDANDEDIEKLIRFVGIDRLSFSERELLDD